jgi:two-component system cell cycle sensor histidine kinase/response regulator CckA
MTEPSYPNAKILLVDDQESNLRLLERILKQGGYICHRSLHDPRQCLAVYQEFQPDLLVLDLMMPHLDGVSLMEQLRPQAEGTYLPILVLTADVTAEAKRRALAAGAKDFLTKPLDAIEVLLRIRNLLETRFLYEKLQQWSEKRIQDQAALLDRANDAILIQDMESRISFWNEGAERLYGWTAAEAVGRKAAELLYKGSAENREAICRAFVSEGKWQGELPQNTRDGRELVVASRWTLVRDEEGRPQSKLVINTDITEKKRLEAQLLQAQRLEAVGLLAGGVAHDFNNLLTVILGYSEVVLREPGMTEPTRELIHQIHKAGERAAALTRQLLAFSRKQILAPVVLDLNALVRETEKMLRRLIGEDIELITLLDPDLGRVKVDPGQLEQILLNLAVNARDAMPAGGKLTIQTQNAKPNPRHEQQRAEVQPGSHVLLAVSDTGCGMDEATQAQIFEPFFTTKGPGKGTGLGLATVYGIVKQSGGSIEVESAPGKGATFQIYLPRLTQQGGRMRSSDRAFRLIPRGTGTVLLVEDDERVRSLGGLALRSAGYTVLEAENGEKALEMCLAHPEPVDLIVTDVVMPKMGGRELAEQVATVRPNLKVVYMSGYMDDTIVRQGVQEGEATLLHKPFTPSVLARKVHEVLGH